MTPASRYGFDQSCRVQAVDLASNIGFVNTAARRAINFIPGSMYGPENCVRVTLAAVKRCARRNDLIILELAENEKIVDIPLLLQIFVVYRRNDLRVAIDDLGAGFSGLNLLAHFKPDAIRLNIEVPRGLDQEVRRWSIIGNVVRMAAEPYIAIIAEGAETDAEVTALRNLGVYLI